MPSFRSGHAADPDWRRAAESCIEQLGGASGNLGFLYVADLFADVLQDILDLVRARTGVAHWVGTVGMGVIGTACEYMDQPAVSLMVGELDPESFSLLPMVRTAEDLEAARVRCGSGIGNFAVVHGDPRNNEIVGLVAALAGKVESGFLVGGLTSSRKLNLQIADAISQGGLSGVVFSGDVAVATRLTQGCSPVGPKHTITECQRNIVVSIDNRPALDVLRADVGDRVGKDLNRIGGQVFVGLPIKGSDTGDYLVRNLVGLDPQNKIVAVGDLVEQGQAIMFCRRDLDSAAEDMNRMLASIKQGLFGKPRGGVYYSCLGRGPNLFGSASEETRLIKDALGDFPLTGFFCNGEISHSRLYGYTGVLTLFV